MKCPRKVYAIRHNVTDRVYIGSSCNVDRRFKEHLYALQAHTHIVDDMQKDYDEHGEDYTLTILDQIKDESEIEKEYEWMDKYQSFVRGVGYNYKDKHRTVQSKNSKEETFTKSSSDDFGSVNTLNENEAEFLALLREHRNDPDALITIALVLSQFINVGEYLGLNQNT